MRVEINFNICRICLQNGNGDMLSIFDTVADKADSSGEILYQKIERCGGIEVLPNPELPNKICRRCNIFLNIAHKFRTMCKSADDYLREFMCNSSEDAEAAGNEIVHKADNAAPERLLKIKGEAGTATVAKVLKEAGHDIDESQTHFDYEEIDEYSDMWLYDNDGDIRNSTAIMRSRGEAKPVMPTSIVRRSSRTRKTLDISSDGAAVISVGYNNLQKPEKDVHICHICGNIYNRKYALEAHMRRHRNEKPFECEICHKDFHLNFQLTRHMRKHTGARPYTCQYCKRTFSDRSTMVKHERIHRNERPYICETCGKSFTYSSVLKVHKLTHTGEKPYTCGICSKRFTRAHHLRAHLETLQHQNDPRSKQLLKEIKKEVEALNGDD